jgi:hypothetical protein
MKTAHYASSVMRCFALFCTISRSDCGEFVARNTSLHIGDAFVCAVLLLLSSRFRSISSEAQALPPSEKARPAEEVDQLVSRYHSFIHGSLRTKGRCSSKASLRPIEDVKPDFNRRTSRPDIDHHYGEGQAVTCVQKTG